MAIYNLKISKAKGRSAIKKFEYIERVNNFSWEKNEKFNDFVYSENCNMPLFAKDNPIEFWKKAEEYERINSNVFREIEFSLPHELSIDENIKLATDYAKEMFGSKYVYSLAVHSKALNTNKIENIHCHIMFSERELDGIERSPEVFFKRANVIFPEKGGCKKNFVWNNFSKLYNIRQTWERIANGKLKEKNIELISSKSLKNQRIEALLEENYLKAEMLDRPPIGYNKKILDYSTNTELVNEIKEFNEYAKKIKEMKEKEFKLLSSNFQVENEKAKERFIKSCCEKEGKEYVPSNFDVEENKKYEQFNFENVFLTSLENKILIDKKENNLKKIKQITLEDKKNRALKILTKDEYSKNLKELENLNSIYNRLADKSEFLFMDKKYDLEKYFDRLKADENFNKKLKATIENIENKYAKSVEVLVTDLEFLRNNKFKEVYLGYSPKKFELSKLFIKEAIDSIKELKIRKEEIDQKVKEHKEILNKNHKLDMYMEIKPIFIEKYNELEKWKRELKNEIDINTREQLETNIATREMSFDIIDVKYNIKEKLENKLKEVKKEYKVLRQAQDDIMGQISHSSLMVKELHSLKEYRLISANKELEMSCSHVDLRGSTFDKMKYNMKLDKLYQDGKKFKLENIVKLEKFKVPDLREEMKKEYSTKIKNDILQLKLEIENSNKILSKLILTEEKIKDRILDKHTNGEYSKEKNYIKSYENLIRRGQASRENISTLELCKSIVKEFEDKYKITNEEITIEKQLMRTDFLDTQLKLTNTKEELNLYFKLLKNINKNSKIKRIKQSKFRDNKRPSRLKILETGRINFEDRDEITRRRKEWENSL